MDELEVTTFDQHVGLVSQLSPHGLVLDWGRRLELAQREYLRATTGESAFRLRLCERQVAKDPRLGPQLSEQLRLLRLQRNATAHQPTSLTPQEAATFAALAFDALGQLSLML
jgi:hypothetical protein